MGGNASINVLINDQTRKSDINITDKLKNTQTMMYLVWDLCDSGWKKGWFAVYCLCGCGFGIALLMFLAKICNFASFMRESKVVIEACLSQVWLHSYLWSNLLLFTPRFVLLERQTPSMMHDLPSPTHEKNPNIRTAPL